MCALFMKIASLGKLLNLLVKGFQRLPLVWYQSSSVCLLRFARSKTTKKEKIYNEYILLSSIAHLFTTLHQNV